jgi:hypothetical protein
MKPGASVLTSNRQNSYSDISRKIGQAGSRRFAGGQPDSHKLLIKNIHSKKCPSTEFDRTGRCSFCRIAAREERIRVLVALFWPFASANLSGDSASPAAGAPPPRRRRRMANGRCRRRTTPLPLQRTRRDHDRERLRGDSPTRRITSSAGSKNRAPLMRRPRHPPRPASPTARRATWRPISSPVVDQPSRNVTASMRLPSGSRRKAA